MGIFQQFPYTNFHEMNLDQIIKIMREMQDEWEETKTEWASYKDFIDNYFATLDLDAEVLAAIRRMAATGELNEVVDPVIIQETITWLSENITPTTPAIDASLTVSGAGADAEVTGFKVDSLEIFGSKLAKDIVLLTPDFKRGTYLGNGNFDASYAYRIATDKFTVDAALTVDIDNGFRIRAIKYDKNTGIVQESDNWATGSYTFTTDWLYAVNIARVTEDTDEIADIATFASKVWSRSDLFKHTLQASDINIGLANADEVCGSDLDNLPLNRMFGMAGGVTIAHAPARTGFVACLSQRYRTAAGAATTQIFIDEYGTLYTRIYWGSHWTAWKEYQVVTPLKILALGDSICRGGRNNNKGFVGDLGFPYINMGVGNATITNANSTYSDSIHHFPDADNIPNQLVSYYDASNEDILTAFGIDKFYPDVIIAEGGINDYWGTDTMGNIPTIPISTDTQAAALDRSTLMGALQWMFYQMVKRYRRAQRFFLITHKTYNVASSYYCPTTVRSAGYTQQQMHDAIVACCKVYGVKVIDVYDESMLNTRYGEYRSQAEVWTDAGPMDFCDHDGVHPLAYGYLNAYVPLVKQALEIGTQK